MKKLLIAATALLLTAGALQAQTADTTKFKKHHRGTFARKGHDGMQKLNLTEDQKKQIKDLNDSYRRQFSELRNNKSISADEMKSKSQAMRKEQFGKMQSLLTAEQKTQIAAQRKERGGKDGMRRGDRTGFDRSKGFGDMKEKLGLTEDQSAKLKTSQQAFREKIKSIRTDSKLTDEQKKDQVKALVKQQQENMKSILSPEQLEKMKAGRKHKYGSK